MNLTERSCREFTELTASPAPAPGGGGVSALAAALAASLGDMVGELTVGKKKYAAAEPLLREKMGRAQELRVRLLELVEEDAENFLPLAAAYSIPKDAPGRAEELERCLLLAAEAPAEVFRLCCECIDLQAFFAENGSRLMISDAACGAALARGALQGAAVNVRVNTRLMKNRAAAEALEAELSEKLSYYEEKADRIFRSVMDTL